MDETQIGRGFLNQRFIRVQSAAEKLPALREIQFAFARRNVMLVAKCQRNNSRNQTVPRQRKESGFADGADIAVDADAAVPRQSFQFRSNLHRQNHRQNKSSRQSV